MARFKMRLVQQTTEEGSGDFTLEADSPEAAAAILDRAWKVAMAQGSSLVRLPDGQVQPDRFSSEIGCPGDARLP